MKHEWSTQPNHQTVSYHWKCKNNWQNFKLIADKTPVSIDPNSETEFITEHYWGYTKINEHKTFEYEVTHPKWRHYPIKRFELGIDYGLVYGEDFAFLNNLQPKSVRLAEGSEIAVEGKKKL